MYFITTPSHYYRNTSKESLVMYTSENFGILSNNDAELENAQISV
jgi:hypothetical protein